MPRHVRIDHHRYSTLQGARLDAIGNLSIRLESLEQFICDIANTLRAHGFRPYCPVGQANELPQGMFESRVIGVFQKRVWLRFPWQAKLESSIISFDISGVVTAHYPIEASPPRASWLPYDALVTQSVGMAAFKRGEWKPLRRARSRKRLEMAAAQIMKYVQRASGARDATRL